MKALMTVFFISLCSIELLFGAGLKKESSGNNQVAKSSGLEARYDFSISFGISNYDFPESIVVTLKGNSDSISLNGLIFEFQASNGSYWAFNDDFRFTEIPLKISKDSTFCKEFRLDELLYQSFQIKERVSFKIFKAAIQTNQVIKVSASIGDLSKAKNPFESNLYTRSNVIVYKKPTQVK